MSSMRSIVFAAALIATLPVAPLAAGATKNACFVVTAADVSAALKGKVGAGKHEQLGVFNACTYTLRKITVTVKTRAITKAAYAKAVRKIPGTALKATDIGDNAWVYFVTHGEALDDWKRGSELALVVVGAEGDAVLIIKALAKVARSRL